MDKLREQYLLLLRDSISDALFSIPVVNDVKQYPVEIKLGKIWPSKAISMIGLARLDNIKLLLENVIRDKIPGDFLEAGVWRGGACVFAKGLLNSYNETDRNVILADSFEGLPPPDPKYVEDIGDTHSTNKILAVSDTEVRNNFIRFGLLDDKVKFIKGYFKDSFARTLPFEKLAILRLDGDMYGSTIETLEALYDKVSTGGYIIIDDYALKGAHMAVDFFRKQRNITDPVNVVDWTGIWWQKS